MYSLTRHLYHRFRRPHLNGFSALTINYLLMQLAVEMVGSFGVLFVWQLGSNWRQGLFFVLLFFGFQRLVVGLSLFFVGNLYSRVEHRWVMALAQLALIAKLWILRSNPGIGALFLAFALGGFYIATYYLGFHSLFLFGTKEQHVGREIGLIDMLGGVSGIIAPLFAGILIDRFGFGVMFVVAMLFLMFSSLSLFLMRHTHIPIKSSSIRSVVGLLWREPYFSRSVYWWHIEDAIGTFFWPIFLILILKNYAIFGAVGSLVMIVSSFMVYFSGYLYDLPRRLASHRRSGRAGKRPLSIFPGASFALGIMWVVRFLSRTLLTVGVADVLYRLISPVWWMKIRRYELAIGEHANRMDFAIAHELMITAGSLTGLVIGYLLLVIGNLNWYWLLFPALGGLFFSVLAVKDR